MAGTPTLKILHVSPYLPPDRIGGVGEVVAHLHRALLQAGHDSVVLTAGRSTNDGRIIRIADSPTGFLIRVAGSARRTEGFDVVHCHNGEALALALAMRACRIRTPVLATYHVSFREFARAHRPYRIEGRSFGHGWRNWKYRLVTCSGHRVTDRMMLALATQTSFISRSAAVDVLGPRRGARAQVVYNGLPPLAEPVAVPRSMPQSESLLYVGNASDRKRISVLPFVLRRVRRQRPGVRLTIVGVEREEVRQVEALFREFGQEDFVSWLGRLRSNEITRIYRNASLLLVPSACEGLPMVVLEALQCGLPCVATRVSGHPEVIEEGVTGFLVDRDDPEQMAERCVRILADGDLRRRMGEAGRDLVAEKFCLDRQVREYLDIYRELRESPSR